MKLEVYAAKLFNEFCYNQGIKGNWEYVSKERKLVWIEEALYLLKSSLELLKSNFTPIKQVKHQTSFEIGYYQGLTAERYSTLSFIDYTLEDLDNQYENLKK